MLPYPYLWMYYVCDYVCRQTIDRNSVSHWIRNEIKSMLETCSKDLNRMKKNLIAEEVNATLTIIEKVSVCILIKVMIANDGVEYFISILGSKRFHGNEKVNNFKFKFQHFCQSIFDSLCHRSKDTIKNCGKN